MKCVNWPQINRFILMFYEDNGYVIKAVDCKFSHEDF